MEEKEPVKGQERYENQILGHRLTPVGWQEVRWRGKEEVLVDPFDLVPVDTPLGPLHKKFKDKHRHALNLFFSAMNQVIEAKRHIPILREELIEKLKLNKQVIKDLVDFGLLKQEVIPLEKGKQKLGGRAVLIPTREARILMRQVEKALLEVMDATKENCGQVIGVKPNSAGEPAAQASP